MDAAKKWRWFVKADAVLTAAAALAVWGYYVWRLIGLGGFMTLGTLIEFAVDFCGLIMLMIAAAVLGAAWRRYSRGGVLVGTAVQMIYSGSYLYLAFRCGGFATPAMRGSVPLLGLGAAGFVVCLAIPRRERGWDD